MPAWGKLSDADLPGPPKFPPTDAMPPEYFKEGPAGDPDNVPNEGGVIDTGWGTYTPVTNTDE